MKHKTSRISALFLALILALGHVSISGRAAETKTDPSYVTESDYHYAVSGKEEKTAEDHFIFREDCFMRSSFLGCSHLALLSCQGALASTGYYEKTDPYLTDHGHCANNILAFLEKAGFSEEEANGYYSTEKQESSMAVAVGQRTIQALGETYTLLAVFPRSAGYGQEWTGNFTVGQGDIHEGYKAARDEVLRFVKAYIEKHHITGPLKIWIAGHSRGGATAGLVGGFLAGGGAAYFGDAVTLEPQDVYCYTFASPRVVKAGLDKKTEMSVDGARSGDAYGADTPGQAWEGAAGTDSAALDPQAACYGGIRNYLFSGDLITLVPPGDWGFTRYGTAYFLQDLGADKADMLEALQTLSPIMYKAFTEGGDYDDFRWQTFDLARMTMTEDTAPHQEKTLAEFMAGRVAGLLTVTKSQEAYVQEGYQAVLGHTGGLYGLISSYLFQGCLKDKLEVNGFIRPAILLVLSYGVERIQAEQGISDEMEALSRGLVDVLGYLSGRAIDPDSFTVDGLLEIAAVWLTDQGETPLGERAFAAILGAIPESVSGLLRTLIGGFHKDNSLFNRVSVEEALRAYIRACAYGPDPECSAAKNYPTAADARGIVFTLLPLLGLAVPQMSGLLDDGAVTPFAKVVEALGPLLLKGQDEAGNEISYETLSQAADEELLKAIEALMDSMAEDSATRYGETYQAGIQRHWEGIKKNITQLRRGLSYTLFYTAGESFSTAGALANACTFGASAPMLPTAHYNESYTAWMKAAAKAVTEEEHYIEHVAGRAADKQKEGLVEHWAWHEGETLRYFTDRTLSRELTADQLVIPKETEAPTTTAASTSIVETTGRSQNETPSAEAENSTRIPAESAPGESGTGEGGPMALWIAAGLLAAGGCLAGLLVWKKKKEK